MKKPVILIKLGGSVITNKDIPMSLRADVLKRLIKEIAQARKQKQDTLFVLGHGQGSYAHVPAVRYKTMQGFINDESPMGMAIVTDVVGQLNRIVVHECLEQDLPAVSLYASNSVVTANRKPYKFFTDVFEQYIKNGLFPVTCGDVLVDKDQGCTIWSTEEILSFFAQQFVERGWKVEQIVHAVEVDGFYDLEKKVVPKITKENWPSLKEAITSTKGFDVTGGMGLKVEESLALAEKGIHSKIVSGIKPGNLLAALVGKDWLGTEIL